MRKSLSRPEQDDCGPSQTSIRHQVLKGAHLGAMDDLALLVEGTDRDALDVDIQTDVNHKAPPQVGQRENHYP